MRSSPTPTVKVSPESVRAPHRGNLIDSRHCPVCHTPVVFYAYFYWLDRLSLLPGDGETLGKNLLLWFSTTAGLLILVILTMFVWSF